MILNIIFLVLKIIGILLLAIIALLLLLVLTVLIVPICYTVNVRHGGNIYADGRVNWLLHLFNARISYTEEKLHFKVRFLVFTLYDNLKPKKPKNQARKTLRKRNRRSAVLKSGKSHVIRADAVGHNKKDNVNKPQSGSINKDFGVEEARNNFDKVYYKSHETEKSDSKNISDIEYSDNSDINGNNINVNMSKRNSYYSDSFANNTNNKDKDTWFSSITNAIKNIIDKIKEFIKAVKDKIVQLFNTATDIKLKIKLITDFLQDTVNREGFRLTYSEIKKILKHILPGRLKSTIKFGTGDPCSTGQALGAMSIIYSFYGDKVTITPDFENKVLEGKHYAKGRIRLITILIIVLKLIKDKRFKQLKRNFQLLKEAL